jgi:hypothetical protein
MKLEFSGHIFEKSSNIKFHKNPSSGSRVVPCGQTDGQTDVTKVIVAFRSCANAPKNLYFHTFLCVLSSITKQKFFYEPFIVSNEFSL